jgi:NAD kinase
MERLTENKIVLVVRKTRLEEMVAKYNTISQAKFYVEHLGADFSDYLNEHENYYRCVRQSETTLQQLGRVQTVDRSFLTNFLFGPHDIVVALGQDGLVANTLKYLNGHPLIGVNPDPKRWDGVLLPFNVNELGAITQEVFSGQRKIQEVTMAKAQLNNGQYLYGVNDIFIGPKSHTSARYTIKLNDKQEQHSSSGIIVSTGLGSTGWLKSLLAGAGAITQQQKKIQHQDSPWDVDYLFFTVREPFPSKSSAATLVHGKIHHQSPLTLTSQMPENGVIFSDGMEADFLEFNSGIVAELGIAEKKGHLVV